MEKFSILTKFDGYISKTDLTNTPESYLISGSQNMLLNDFEKWESRGAILYSAPHQLIGIK